MKSKREKELEAEVERLKMLNQALTDELDAIYEDTAETDMLFEEFLEAESLSKGTLH